MFALAAVPAGALALTGCGPNYSGRGNEFVVDGRVTGPGHQSLKANILVVEEAAGEATNWFRVGTIHQLHDNCDCVGFWNSNHKFGEVVDRRGNYIDPIDVAVGACVRFTGKIRANSEGKYSSDRPVYDLAEVESCDQLPK